MRAQFNKLKHLTKKIAYSELLGIRQTRIVELGETMPFYCMLSLVHIRPPVVIEIKY